LRLIVVVIATRSSIMADLESAAPRLLEYVLVRMGRGRLPQPS
jgi:hypothetical protein